MTLKSKKSTWKVQVLGSLKEGDVEISVIKRSNKHGQQSYGWGGLDKVILCTDDLLDEEVWLDEVEVEENKKVFDEIKKRASIICDAFNAMGVV